MKIYLVGGAVRDILLGKEPNDHDYVVVGTTPDEMLNLGYTQVGSNFPVFLHPVTGDEYALARKEYSTGNGYMDFKCTFGADVTLEEDLERRDLIFPLVKAPEIMQIKLGEKSQDYVMGLIDEMYERVTEKLEASDLPEHNDVSRFEDLLVGCYSQQIALSV